MRLLRGLDPELVDEEIAVGQVGLACGARVAAELVEADELTVGLFGEGVETHELLGGFTGGIQSPIFDTPLHLRLQGSAHLRAQLLGDILQPCRKLGAVVEVEAREQSELPVEGRKAA